MADCLYNRLQGYSGPAVLDVSHWLVKELEQHKGASQETQQQQTPRKSAAPHCGTAPVACAAAGGWACRGVYETRWADAFPWGCVQLHHTC
jgi:hypothetical protein